MCGCIQADWQHQMNPADGHEAMGHHRTLAGGSCQAAFGQHGWGQQLPQCCWAPAAARCPAALWLFKSRVKLYSSACGPFDSWLRLQWVPGTQALGFKRTQPIEQHTSCSFESCAYKRV